MIATLTKNLARYLWNGVSFISSKRLRRKSSPCKFQIPQNQQGKSSALLIKFQIPQCQRVGWNTVEWNPACNVEIVYIFQCPPCRAFTPELIETYEKIKSDGKPFEIVFISSDRTVDGFKEYYESMPWLALPYKDPRSAQLSRLFEVQG